MSNLSDFNFVGVVTQQDVNTGVTLRARVTSPKGHYTAYQDFRCMVKQTGISDEQAVIIDLNTVSNRLLLNGVIGITENIASYMPAEGENGTSIQYTFTGDNISNYINDDGRVIKRPAYGSNAVLGSLNITVTKNAAVAKKGIDVSIEPYTIEEVTQFALDSITWDTIRDRNDPETTDISTNGMYNVIYPLVLNKTIENKDMISTPITVTWSIEQDILKDLFEERINVNTGAIVRPAYLDVYDVKNSIPASMIEIITSKKENVSKDLTYMRIGGLTLRADISINNTLLEDKVVRFNLKTLTTALTNTEVISYLRENVSMFSVKDDVYGYEYAASSASDVSEGTAHYDINSTNSSVLKMFNSAKILSLTATNDLTNKGIETSIRWKIANPDTFDSSTVTFIGATEYSSIGLVESGDEVSLTLNPVTAPSRDKLILYCEIRTLNYDGSFNDTSLAFRFNLIDATDTTGDSSGGGTGDSSGGTDDGTGSTTT